MKTFNLIINGSVYMYNKSMSLCQAMKNKLKGQPQYKGCTFEIKYNGTNR